MGGGGAGGRAPPHDHRSPCRPLVPNCRPIGPRIAPAPPAAGLRPGSGAMPAPPPGADRGVCGFPLAAHIDAPRRAPPGAQLTPDALLHPVRVPVEDVTPVETLRLDPLVLRVLRPGAGAGGHLLEGHPEAGKRATH